MLYRVLSMNVIKNAIRHCLGCPVGILSLFAGPILLFLFLYLFDVFITNESSPAAENTQTPYYENSITDEDIYDRILDEMYEGHYHD